MSSHCAVHQARSLGCKWQQLKHPQTSRLRYPPHPLPACHDEEAVADWSEDLARDKQLQAGSLKGWNEVWTWSRYRRLPLGSPVARALLNGMKPSSPVLLRPFPAPVLSYPSTEEQTAGHPVAQIGNLEAVSRPLSLPITRPCPSPPKISLQSLLPPCLRLPRLSPVTIASFSLEPYTSFVDVEQPVHSQSTPGHCSGAPISLGVPPHCLCSAHLPIFTQALPLGIWCAWPRLRLAALLIPHPPSTLAAPHLIASILQLPAQDSSPRELLRITCSAPIPLLSPLEPSHFCDYALMSVITLLTPVSFMRPKAPGRQRPC